MVRVSGRLVLTAIFLIATVTAAQAGTSYFVTQAGAGSHNGLSLANAWSVANYNAATLPTGGDTVFFSGTITSTVIPNTSGTGNGAARLTLDFTGAALSTAIPRIRIAAKAFLNVNGGTINPVSSNENYLIDFNLGISHDITIQGWSYTGPAGNAGIELFLNLRYCFNLVVQNNKLDNILGFINGDTTNNHDVTIQNNFARNSVNTVDQSDIISVGDMSNVIIQGNKFVQQAPGAVVNNHNDIIQTFQSGATPNGPPQNWVVRYNWIELNVGSGSGDNSWMMMENMSGNPAAKIYSNVFLGTGPIANNGVDFNNDSTATVFFYNNTVIRHASPDNTIRFQAPASVLFFRNNAGEANTGISGTWLQFVWSAGAVWDHNFFLAFLDCTATYSGPQGSCATDPKFTDYTNNNFALQSTSPLIGAGDSTIGSEFNSGIASGATWPNPALVTRPAGAWDIGAYQTGTTPTTKPNAPSGLTGTVQ